MADLITVDTNCTDNIRKYFQYKLQLSTIGSLSTKTGLVDAHILVRIKYSIYVKSNCLFPPQKVFVQTPS